MPNDLENAFAALSDDARRARLAGAADIRRRSDRRAVKRSVTGVALVAALVGGAVVSTRAIRADQHPAPLPAVHSTPPPSSPAPPAASPSPSPTSPSSASPSSASPPVVSTPPVPASIPARAFLGRSDADTVGLKRLATAHPSPALCAGAAYPSDTTVGVRATVGFRYRTVPGQTPAGEVAETVTVYRGSGAAGFLHDLRAAVRRCPAGQRDGLTYTYRLLGSIGAGDESVLVQGSTPARGDDGELSADGSRNYLYLVAVRVGDAVALVENTGYEAVSADRAGAEAFAGRAAHRLSAWRG